MTQGIVFDIQRFSLHDGPGLRTTVFLKGCPMACWWCHNPESQATERELMVRASRCIQCGACLEACERGALSWSGDVVTTDPLACNLCGTCSEACCTEAREIVGQEKTVAQVMAEVGRDVAFYDQSGGGVTFSGGEPLSQPEFLLALLRASKEMEIHTSVDTCGFASWETCDSLRPYTDLFLYDLKLMDDSRHQRFTGVSNGLILRNLRRLAQVGEAIILRVPVIPGINDDDENMRQIGAFAASQLQLERADILPYHSIARDKYDRLNREYALPTTRPPDERRLVELAQLLESFGLEVKIGG